METVVHGTVVGDAGAAVAGWIQLGSGPRRWIADQLRVAVDSGEIVTITGLRVARIEPVERRRGRWSELEADPINALVIDDAPAPEVEVAIESAILRGGDSIAVAGLVAASGFAADGGPRRAPSPTVRRLDARAVGRGDDCERHLARAQEDEAPPVSRSSASSATPARPPDRTHLDLLARNPGLWLAAPALALLGTIAVAWPVARAPSLCAMASIVGLPLVLDGLRLRLHDGAVRPRSLEVPGVGYFVAGAVSLLFWFGLVSGHADPAKRLGLRVAAVILTAVAVGSTGWIAVATRRRRRLVRLALAAPPHTMPPAATAWGACDGRFSGGGRVAVVGERVSASGPWKRRTVRTEALIAVAAAPRLSCSDRAVPVQLAQAEWVSTVVLRRFTGTDSLGDHGERGAVIESDQPVRAVGRVRDGVLARGGVASLLVFASAPGTDVARELIRLRWRDRIGLGLAASCAILWIVGAGLLAFG